MRRIKFTAFLSCLIAFGIMLGLAVTPQKVKAKPLPPCTSIKVLFGQTEVTPQCGQTVYTATYYIYDSEGNEIDTESCLVVSGPNGYVALPIDGFPPNMTNIMIAASIGSPSCEESDMSAYSWVTSGNTATICARITGCSPFCEDC